MMRLERAKRGEMLIETIVAFAVLMVLLSMVTTAVRGAIALNNRATKRLSDLAADCAKVESADYTKGSNGTLTLVLLPDKSSCKTMGAITEDLRIYEGRELRVFHLKDDVGTNTGGGGTNTGG